MSRRPTLEELFGISPKIEDGATRLARDLRAARSEAARDDDQGAGASAGTRDPDAFGRAIRERAEEKRLGWDDLDPDDAA